MKAEDLIKTKIDNALFELTGLEFPQYEVSYTDNLDFGDISSNIALINYSKVKDKFGSSRNFAEMIVNTLRKDADLDGVFKDIKVEGVGFINFYFTNGYLQQQIKKINEESEKYGESLFGKGKKASVEYVSANPTGPLHIGNARGGPIGDVLSNVLEKAGYKVSREYLHNDVGGQVIKLGETIRKIINNETLEETQYKGEYVKEIAQNLKDGINGKSDEEIGKMAVDILFKEIIKDCEDMGIKFDSVVKESDLRLKASAVIENLQSKGFVKEKDGALWFAPQLRQGFDGQALDEFLKDRETVVRKSDGEFTYFSSDIVYHKEKFESGADLIIDVLGSNHSGHVPRLQAVIKALGFDVKRFKAILYQYVRVKKGSEIVKMSKRAGDFVTAREVLDEVGQDSLRFFLLTVKPETHMDFDLELAKKQASDNPVFYVQYAHARISSILKKDEAKILDTSTADLYLLKEKEEMLLARHLIKFPVLIEVIATDYAVNRLTTYSLLIADLFHKFYERCKILSDDKNLSSARLALVKSTQTVLQNTLSLLGISAPEKM